MNVESLQINTSGTNLANVNNPNYAEETVNVGANGVIQTPYGAESSGLSAESVTSLRNALIDSQVRESSSSVSYYSTLQSAYQQAQSALGQTVSSSTATGTAATGSGLGSALTGFFNAFQSFATSPSSTGQQQQVVAAAGVLTDQIQSTDANLAQVQAGLASQATGDVTSANSLLTDIAGLNGQIAQYEAGKPGSAVSLRDQRESDLEQLAGLMPISVTENAAGESQVSATDASGNPVALVTNAKVTGPITLSGGTVSAGSPSTALRLGSGSIQGSLDASSGALQALRDSLDQLSSQLVTSVNGVYNPTGTGQDFFDASGTTASTISLDPGLSASNLQAGSSGASGDNSLALGIANLANQVFSTGAGDQINGTLSNFYSSAVSGFGQSLASVNDQVTNETNIQNLVTSQRESASGVSLDQEMANLLMYQRSYQASGQVFQVVDSLIDTTINSLGTITA
jgi:flagellar hook-associated protein 1 FlgK